MFLCAAINYDTLKACREGETVTENS